MRFSWKPLVIGAAAVLLFAATQLGSMAAEPGDANRVPTADDAARAAAEQLKQLPETVVQVDCAPGVPTLRPYTRLSGVPGANPRYVLADGRCFVDPNGEPPDLQDAIIP